MLVKMQVYKNISENVAPSRLNITTISRTFYSYLLNLNIKNGNQNLPSG